MAAPKGNKFASGGARSGAGRKPDAFKEKYKRLGDSKEFYAWAQRVIDGKEAVDPELRLKVWERVCDRGYGKPAQEVEVSGLSDFFEKFREQYS